MNCPSCHTPNHERARFCSNCACELAATVMAQPVGGGVASAAAPAPAVEPDEEVTSMRGPASRRQASTVIDGAPPVAEGKRANADGRIDAKPLGVDVLLGRTISEGRYRIDAKIGRGGMGDVYRAARLLIGDEVAIKFLHPEHVSERFQREAQAAARLKHPNAVTIYDFGITSDGLVYLAMELLAGQSLRAFIKQEGPLSVATAAEILNQACSAIEEAHRLQIVHRDIKPDNIIVNPTLNGLRVKVLDFGIAKLRDETAGDLTQTGAVL